MGGLPVVFIGYELADDALEPYGPSPFSSLDAIRAMLRDVESATDTPVSFVRYEDQDPHGPTHSFICCFRDTSRRPYTSSELDAIAVPAGFERLPELVKARGGLKRVFAPRAHVFSIDREKNRRHTSTRTSS